MALTTAAAIASYMCTIYEDATFVARERSVMPGLVTVFGDASNEVQTRTRSTYAAATVATIGETDDLQAQAWNPSQAQILTPSEAGAQFFITDQRLSADPFGIRNDAAVELGNAMAEKFNDDLLGDLASLTGGTVGAAGTVITWGHYFAALAQLAATKAPKPWRVVLHTYQWHVLAKAVAPGATVTNAPTFQDEVTRQWYAGSAGGADIYVTSDLTIDGSGDVTSGAFSALALALDVRRAPRLEPERDASRRGWELNMTAVYAHGVWRPEWGIKLIFDAATPSS